MEDGCILDNCQVRRMDECQNTTVETAKLKKMRDSLVVACFVVSVIGGILLTIWKPFPGFPAILFFGFGALPLSVRFGRRTMIIACVAACGAYLATETLVAYLR